MKSLLLVLALFVALPAVSSGNEYMNYLNWQTFEEPLGIPYNACDARARYGAFRYHCNYYHNYSHQYHPGFGHIRINPGYYWTIDYWGRPCQIRY